MKPDEMQMHRPEAYQPASELEVMAQVIAPVGARVLELGCGRAWMTRKLVESFNPAQVIATEVDRIQHEKNLLIDDLPQVRFVYGGAEAINLADGAMDLVIMLKSLHHVPLSLMDKAFDEIARVLRPGGAAYISEPVYAGAFNEILRLFNDEKQVREAAFGALLRAVERGLFTVERQIFFLSNSRFADFAEFDERIVRATHSNHQLDQTLYDQVRKLFQAHMTAHGAEFSNPVRVDVLRKPL